jgi:type VI secretion system protein ImpF
MTAYVPGLLERLMGERAQTGQGAAAGRAGIEQLKDSVARDLEALLNTRTALAQDVLAAYPLARASVLNYGLADFAAFCLSSSADRAAICAALAEAIARHEPRLGHVSASLEPAAQDGKGVNRLAFVIHATLQAGPGAAIDTVDFNAVLQPSTLHYAVGKPGRNLPP